MNVLVMAQDASNSYSLPSGSLSVEYYNDRKGDLSKNGRLVFNNSSDASISKVHIRVTVDIRWKEQNQISNVNIPVTNKKTLVLCDDDFDNIPGKTEITKTNSKRGVIKGGPEKPNKYYSYNIEITNVVSQGVSFPTSGVQKSSPLNSGDELMYDQLKIGGLYCDQIITVDVYYSPSTRRCYANMTSPERINNMTIYRLDDSNPNYNAYISYNGCSTYFLYVNPARW